MSASTTPIDLLPSLSRMLRFRISPRRVGHIRTRLPLYHEAVGTSTSLYTAVSPLWVLKTCKVKASGIFGAFGGESEKGPGCFQHPCPPSSPDPGACFSRIFTPACGPPSWRKGRIHWIETLVRNTRSHGSKTCRNPDLRRFGEPSSQILGPEPPWVVAKVLKPRGNAPSAARMWLREASIHSKLSASNLPTIIQLLGLDARVHSLYLEHVAAPSLAHRDWRGPDNYFSGTSADAERVLKDMASALAFVHGNGVTHNDVKPGNILLGAARGAVLIDFGLSSDSARDSEALTTVGTPWYIPPEFLQTPAVGRGQPGDVWALGIVMMYLRNRFPIPESGTEWKIWDVANHVGPRSATARACMTEWLQKVRRERERPDTTPMDEIIRRMTDRERETRATIHQVAESLAVQTDAES
ncbi:hypothetical protein VTK26DRAFT_5676 [Humicola hyalothermophila]